MAAGHLRQDDILGTLTVTERRAREDQEPSFKDPFVYYFLPSTVEVILHMGEVGSGQRGWR